MYVQRLVHGGLTSYFLLHTSYFFLQAAVYVQRLVHGVLGLELSEDKDTMRRYIVTHEDRARGLFFHPVLLEKVINQVAEK